MLYAMLRGGGGGRDKQYLLSCLKSVVRLDLQLLG